MDLDLHITRFDWAGSPAGIGPGVARLARTAEAVGVNDIFGVGGPSRLDLLDRCCSGQSKLLRERG